LLYSDTGSEGYTLKEAESMNLECKPSRNPALHTEMMDGELLLYDPSGSRIIQLNSTAALIWQLCDGQRTVQEMISLLQAAYPDASGSIALDVPEMLDRWAEAGCLEPE
jgi:hypothetical protein